MAASCGSLAAWCPGTWDVPHLLSFDIKGGAHFDDQTGALKGRCVTLVQCASELLWGLHGVIVPAKEGLWLFNV